MSEWTILPILDDHGPEEYDLIYDLTSGEILNCDVGPRMRAN